MNQATHFLRAAFVTGVLALSCTLSSAFVPRNSVERIAGQPVNVPALKHSITRAAAKHGVRPDLVFGIAAVESSFREPPRGSTWTGRMQVNCRIHRRVCREARDDIEAGTAVFASYLREENGNVRRALFRYRGRALPAYVSRVLRSAAMYSAAS